MKKIKTLVVVGVLGLLLCGLALAQVHHRGAWHDAALLHHGDSGSVVEHLGKAFPRIAAFDTNKDGQLDRGEQAALAKAIQEGSLELPMPTAPNGHMPRAEMLVDHIGEMYGRIAAYDSNHDGVLDEQELAAIKTAIDKGDLVCPHAP